MKSLLGYYGGKAGAVGAWIAAQLPPHRAYVEPFGGMAGVLMQKGYSPIEVYNDLDNLLVNLFRVLRSEELRPHLEQQLALTNYARKEFDDCFRGLHEETNAVERARRTYVVLAQSFQNALISRSWSFGGAAYGNSVAEKFVNGQVRITSVAERLRRVQIENADWQSICQQWDGPDTLFYFDPPYTRGERNAEGYRFEMKEPAHLELLGWCTQAQGKILLSGYDNSMYAKHLVKGAGWVARPYKTVAHSSASRTKKKCASRTEMLWLNPAAAAATPTLFCDHAISAL